MDNLKNVIEIQRILLDINAKCHTIQDIWESIKWNSIDKDNMQYKALVTNFQIEEMNRIFEQLIGKKVPKLTERAMKLN